MRSLIMVATLAAALVGGAAPAGTPAHDITIRMSNFKYDPATILLHRGEAYALHFRNDASGGHDFVAREFFASSRIAPEDSGKLAEGRVAVAGGEAVTIHLIPERAGLFASRCSHFMHGMFGMTGKIPVE